MKKGLAKQVTFATARMLTDLAAASKEPIKVGLEKTFVVRSKRYTLWSIRSRGANRKNLKATVGSVSPYLAQHVTGGERRKHKTLLQSVPTKEFRNPPTMKTTVSKWPSSLLRKAAITAAKRKAKYAGKKRRKGLAPLPFILKSKRGNKILVKRDPKTKQLKVLYVFKGEVHLKATWQPKDDVVKVVERERFKRFRERLDHALDTARYGPV